jgi:hypothetical protein
MGSQRYVFISYLHEDRLFAARLAADLRTAGFEPWVDTEQIAAGDDWPQTIAAAISKADAFVFVASRASVGRVESYIYLELRHAIERSTRFDLGIPFVFPVVLDDEGAANLPELLDDIQWVDFRRDYAEALSHLIHALPGDIRQQAPVAPAPPKNKGYAFISYADDDAAFVERLKQFLAQKSYAYWEYAESNRNYHTQLAAELEGVITNAVATLSVLSPAWKKSKWTLKEYFFSEEAGVPVFLLKVKEMAPSLAIAGIPYIDFVNNEQAGFVKLAKELARKGL